MNEALAGADIGAVWGWLGEIPDPEIPALSIVDLGIVREVRWADRGGRRELVVTITPTYSG
ncbi:MAG: iron-sulfur cluster assembly protein, partial [Acetobacteraceae bacterium]